MTFQAAREYRETELGKEVKCAKCGDFWPCDSEFFYFSTDGKPHSWCKACYANAGSTAVKRERWKLKQRERRAAASGEGS